MPATKQRGSGGQARARSLARRFAVQALYQWQLTAQPWQDIHLQFSQDEAFPRADAEYFRDVLMYVCEHREALDATLAQFAAIPAQQLDPVEHGVLWLGLYELEHRLEVPFKVAINEAVQLTKSFGATDGHKFVNGVLDRASRTLRMTERAAG
jgi:N utilization substance protein B